MATNGTLIKTLARKIGSLLLDTGSNLRRWSVGDFKPDIPKQSERVEGKKLALVAGYFSFKDGFATFGDTEAMKVACSWLDEAKIEYDIACHHLNGQVGLSVWELDPNRYDIFIFVCGPWKLNNLNILDRFSHCVKIGMNLSIEDTSSNKFDFLYPRDLPTECNPDLVFASEPKSRPTIGVCLVHAQEEYGSLQRHNKIASAVNKYLTSSNIAYVNLDTLYKDNEYGIKDTSCFENLVSRLDVVISSRLHGMVFSLKNNVPVVAIDAISGGAKLSKQASAVNWPIILDGDTVDHVQIDQAVKQCLNKVILDSVKRSQEIAEEKIQVIRSKFLSEINSTTYKTDVDEINFL